MKKSLLNRAQTEGFTLIELLIVILLLSLSLSIVIPVLNRNSKRQVASCARKVAALLSFATNYTLVNNASVKIAVKSDKVELSSETGLVKSVKCPQILVTLRDNGEGNFTVTQGIVPPNVFIEVSRGKEGYIIKYEIAKRNVEIKEKK